MTPWPGSVAGLLHFQSRRLTPLGPEEFAMPKKGKHAVEPRYPDTRRKRRSVNYRREDWIQYAATAAQVGSSIAALIAAIRR